MKKLLAVIAAVGMISVGTTGVFAEDTVQSDEEYQIMLVSQEAEDQSTVLPEDNSVSILESEEEALPEPDVEEEEEQEQEETEAPTVDNPETGVTLGIAAAVVCGVLVIGCIVFSIISKKKKGGKGGNSKKPAKKK
ncbi:MAG: hypothetical protein ACI4J1_02450 [Ruminiclostridium sp.]